MSTSLEPEHPIVTYLSIQERLGNLTRQHRSLQVERDTPVTKALDNVISYPFISFNLKSYLSKFLFMGPNDTSFGSLDSPNIEAIHSQSQPSSFGKGDQTITDPTYRDGREVRGEDLKWSSPGQWAHYKDTFYHLTSDLQNVLEKTLFVRKTVEVKLHKLAMYNKGGHFDWHRDSTHGENHHATILVALNTSWEGGSLLLRHNGQEMTVDMHPKATFITDQETSESSNTSGSEDEPDTDISLRAAAFYTDVEHKVEPVTDGVRLILQYDVFVTPEKSDQDDDFDSSYSNLDNVSGKSRLDYGEKPYDNEIQVPSGFSNETSLSSLADAIQEIIVSGTEEVGIPLRHLYRQASIRKEYLKGVDAIIYAKLSQIFDVSLVPVILEESSLEGEWTGEEVAAYKVLDDEEKAERSSKRAKTSTEFHLNNVSDILEISRTEYIEHTGNEAHEADCSYFGGGMFLRAKSSQA